MKKFREITLGDVLTLQRGFDITKNEQSDGTVPVVSSSGISSFHNKWKVKAPGVVIGRKGTLGTVHLLRSHFWPHDTTLWVKDFKDNDPTFVSYFLKTMKLESFDVGASNPTLNRNHIHKIKIIFPKEIETQKRIAGILSALDEMADINRRRLLLLEKAANEIYREWFVRFRFPGYESNKFSKGLPSEWVVIRIGRRFSTFLGGTPSREEPSYWGGDIPWINSGEINKSRIVEASEFITESGLRSSATKLMPERCTVIAITGATLGQVSLTEMRVCANQSVVGIHDQDEKYNEYIFQFVSTNIDNIVAKQSGGGQQHINKDIVEKEEILLPPKELIEKYNLIVCPIFNQIRTLLFSNICLRRLHASLLPRLISGTLSVENVAIKFSPNMAEKMKSTLSESAHA